MLYLVLCCPACGMFTQMIGIRTWGTHRSWAQRTVICRDVKTVVHREEGEVQHVHYQGGKLIKVDRFEVATERTGGVETRGERRAELRSKKSRGKKSVSCAVRMRSRWLPASISYCMFKREKFEQRQLLNFIIWKVNVPVRFLTTINRIFPKCNCYPVYNSKMHFSLSWPFGRDLRTEYVWT